MKRSRGEDSVHLWNLSQRGGIVTEGAGGCGGQLR